MLKTDLISEVNPIDSERSIFTINPENIFHHSPPVVEEPKEPVDPAVRAKENWLRLYNKVLDQLREVRSCLSPIGLE